MSPAVCERLAAQLTELIGPEAFSRAAATHEAAEVTSTPAAPAAATPTTKTPAPPAPRPAAPLEAVAHTLKGYDLDATVAPHQVVAAATLLDRDGFALDAITGVDWIAQDQMEVVYDYFHPLGPGRVVVRTRVPRAAPELPTISGVFPGANWHERETHDFFGIRFTGHPNLTPFLLPEDADFHPLRKDYQP
jgi:NADH-quinone oxidoreductase subunit C